jgi:ribosomal protein S18 acetylase RimI-like enzyme
MSTHHTGQAILRSTGKPLAPRPVVGESRKVLVRPIQLPEWRAYRAIRLAALADSPDAFGSTLAAEQAMPDDRWRERLAGGRADERRTLFVAVDEDDDWVGLVGSRTPGESPADAELTSMWVAPKARGRRAGTALVATVLEWAAAERLSCVGLWVTEHNHSALRLYRGCGFIETGERQPLPSNPDVPELRMLCTLRAESRAESVGTVR